MTTETLNTYIDSKIEATFITMVKIEMELSGKTFDECKEIVKQFIKTV